MRPDDRVGPIAPDVNLLFSKTSPTGYSAFEPSNMGGHHRKGFAASAAKPCGGRQNRIDYFTGDKNPPPPGHNEPSSQQER